MKMEMNMRISTSEAVFRAHPDKICDQVSDGILDALLLKDKDSRVAIECLIKDNLLVVAGEVTSTNQINYEVTAREILHQVGLNENEFEVLVKVSEQSKDISRGVDKLGAGDQGIMYGYATNETKEFLPLTYVLARNIARNMDIVNRENPDVFGLDGKCQVSIVYEKDKPKHISTVVVSAQTKPGVERSVYEKYIHYVVEEVLPSDLVDINTLILINPTGEFVKGGSHADSGVTGRKLQVDTYGTIVPHGGGAFSGKDYTKVDRSGAYYCRYIAKAIVKSGLANACEVSVAYAIGIPFPVSIDVKARGSFISNDQLRTIVNRIFDFSPSNIIKELKLKQQSYQSLAEYGHFGFLSYPWESISDELIKAIKKEANVIKFN
jgi:S-adenosylmethionine synthetase